MHGEGDDHHTMERRQETALVWTLAAVQFVNVLDFMMVMPMGPDFAKALDIPTSRLGDIGGSYTASAALAGFLGSFALDRFPRRAALVASMIGLAGGTALGGVASGFYSLLFARIVAGFFGGPATALSLSIVTDCVPVERRGRALSVVMGTFAIASIFGVPAGLELARTGGFRLPFFAVAGLALLVTLFAAIILRGLPNAPTRQTPRGSVLALFANPNVLATCALTVFVMMSAFILIPNISTYVQHNLGYPRENLPRLYIYGGVASVGAMALAGRLVDRWGSLGVTIFGCGLLAAVVYGGFGRIPPWFPTTWIFVLFMVAMSFRNLSANTLSTRVPSPEERGRFMSLQSMVQHLAAAIGAFASARWLSTGANGRIEGMRSVAIATAVAQIAVVALVAWLERRVSKKSPNA